MVILFPSKEETNLRKIHCWIVPVTCSKDTNMYMLHDCVDLTVHCYLRAHTCIFTSHWWASSTLTHSACCLLTATWSVLQPPLFNSFTRAPFCSNNFVISAWFLQTDNHIVNMIMINVYYTFMVLQICSKLIHKMHMTHENVVNF